MENIVVRRRTNHVDRGQQLRSLRRAGGSGRRRCATLKYISGRRRGGVTIRRAHHGVIRRWKIGVSVTSSAARRPTGVGLSDELAPAAAIVARAAASLTQQQRSLYRREYDSNDQHQADRAADDVRGHDDYFTQAVHVGLRQVNSNRPVTWTNTANPND